MGTPGPRVVPSDAVESLAMVIPLRSPKTGRRLESVCHQGASGFLRFGFKKKIWQMHYLVSRYKFAAVNSCTGEHAPPISMATRSIAIPNDHDSAGVHDVVRRAVPLSAIPLDGDDSGF